MAARVPNEMRRIVRLSQKISGGAGTVVASKTTGAPSYVAKGHKYSPNARKLKTVLPE